MNCYGTIAIVNNCLSIVEEELCFLEIVAAMVRKSGEETGRAANDMHDYEMQFRSLAENTPDIVVQFDRECRYLFVSSNIEALTGLKADTFPGKTPRDLGFPEEYCSAVEQAVTLVFQSGIPYETEFLYKGNNGPILFNWRLIPERNELGNVERLLSIERDITKNKEAEERLQRNNLLLRIAGRVTKLGGWQVSLPDNHVEWSGEVAAIHETPADFSPSLDEAISFYAPEWQDRIRNVFLACAREGKPYDEEAKLITAKGRHIWVRTLGEAKRDISGRIVGVEGAFMDITERKRYEKITAEAEIRYQNLFMNFHDAIFINYADKVSIVNQACLRLFGAKNQGELLGKSHFDLFSPEYYEITKKRLQQLRVSRQPVPPIEKKIVRLDGTLVDVEVTASPFPFQGTTAIHVILRDITERKQKQAALKESEQRFRMLFDSLSDAVLIRSEHHRFILANQAAIELLGYSQEELSHLGPLDIVSPEYQKMRPKVLEKLAAGDVALFESALKNRDGKIIPVEVNSRQLLFDGKTAVLSIIRDITDRKIAEAALRESEEKHRLLAENTLDTIWQMDMNTRFTYVNTAVSTFGYTPAEYIGTKLEDHCSPEKVSQLMVIMADAIEKNHSRIFETELLHKNGTPIPVEVFGKIIFDAHGAPVCVQGVTRDISERKKAEREQQILQEQLVQAQKMESVGRLAGGVAHDFNNMLGVILGNVDMALAQADEDSTLYADLKEVRQAAKRSVEITQQLLTFARKEKTSPVVLDVNQSLENMLNMLRRLIGENINLLWKPDAKPCQVMLDPSHINQMMTNLCLNARDAIDGPGTITIVTSNTLLDNLFCEQHPGLIPGDYVTILVQDTGCGMSEDTIEHIFEPFFTTKEHGKGTGLGLATLYGIVKQAGGCLEVTSIEGRGSLFTIHLPLVSEEAATKQETREYSFTSDVKGSETILVVEDEPGILRLCTNILEKMGHTVLSASTPTEALHLAETYEKEIHLTITDVIMPEMNGPQLTQKILLMRPKMKCLYMSGYTADIVAQHKLTAQRINSIEKPFSPTKFGVVVSDILAGD